jgi:hypothetical protein
MVACAGYSLTSGFVIASLLFCAYPSHPGVDKNRTERKHHAHTLQNKFKVGRNKKNPLPGLKNIEFSIILQVIHLD